MYQVLRGVSAAALLLGLLALQTPQAARAANFEFGPPTMSLSGSDRIATVTLTNVAADPVRFEVEAFRWDQRPDGQLQLDPTTDLVVFPRLLTLGGHETRRIRVAVSVPPGDVEKTYRLQVSEIPNFNTPSQAPGASIELRSQLRLPIFFAPTATHVAGAISNAIIRHGILTFSVTNSGTTHFITRNLSVTARGAANAALFSKELDGWYVLAGGHRDYSVVLPHCEQIRAITLIADAGMHVSQTIDVPPDACRT
jgi:fimbrial chaperone protein